MKQFNSLINNIFLGRWGFCVLYMADISELTQRKPIEINGQIN